MEAVRPAAFHKYESKFPIQGMLYGTTGGFLPLLRLLDTALAFSEVHEYVRMNGLHSINKTPSFNAHLSGEYGFLNKRSARFLFDRTSTKTG